MKQNTIIGNAYEQLKVFPEKKTLQDLIKYLNHIQRRLNKKLSLRQNQTSKLKVRRLESSPRSLENIPKLARNKNNDRCY